MEKFSKYSDKSTGINPFQPVILQPTILTYIFHFVFIPIKLIAFTPTLIVLPILKIFPESYRLILDVILAYFFNVFDTELTIEGVRKNDEVLKLQKSPKSGDVIIVNAIGPLDWFIFKLISSNPKKVKIGVASSNGIYIFDNFKSWYNWCFEGSLYEPKSSKLIHITDIDASSSNIDGLSDLKELMDDNNTILYVIAEGTLTNNKGILRFPLGFDIGAFAKMVTSSNLGLKIMTVKTTPVGLTNTVIPTNKLWWLFNNFGSMSMNTKYKLKMTVLKDFNVENDLEITDNLIREKLANNGKLKLLSKEMDVKKKKEYIGAVTESLEKKYV